MRTSGPPRREGGLGRYGWFCDRVSRGWCVRAECVSGHVNVVVPGVCKASAWPLRSSPRLHIDLI